MTFSIAARCAETGQLGIALSSSSIAVGARCPWLMPGVGAVSSQNITLPALGPLILAELENGIKPESAVNQVLSESAFSEYRQVTAINIYGETAVFSGDNTLGVHHAVQGRDCVAAGNMLADKRAIASMVDAFETTSGSLAERLLAAMRAAVEAGGEAGPIHSAALKVVDDPIWPVIDLRVDWTETCPVAELCTLWEAYEPQMQDYITRALDPRQAPSYGVPGDE